MVIGRQSMRFGMVMIVGAVRIERVKRERIVRGGGPGLCSRD
jgi:hypothetical protein